ncbi:MAG: hypothetical protein HC786_22045 [Richelia sp. CSU_2_1]|nr:hypothetical protein [Richelia sp. CSU_2_1]
MSEDRLLCGHLITHLQPEVAADMEQGFGIDFNQIAKWTLEDWAEFGQLGIDAQWVLDNLAKIEEVYGKVIDSIDKWNDAVGRLAKKGYTALERIDKRDAELAIAIAQRQAKILEGQDRLTNARSLHADLRKTHSDTDLVNNGMILARALAELQKAKDKAAKDPLIQQSIEEWRKDAKATGQAAKILLQNGFAGYSHPNFPGNDGTYSGTIDAEWSDIPVKSQYQLGGSKQDSISFNWSGNIAGRTKQFVRNVGVGSKKVGKWFGFGGSNVPT